MRRGERARSAWRAGSTAVPARSHRPRGIAAGAQALRQRFAKLAHGVEASRRSLVARAPGCGQATPGGNTSPMAEKKRSMPWPKVGSATCARRLRRSISTYTSPGCILHEAQAVIQAPRRVEQLHMIQPRPRRSPSRTAGAGASTDPPLGAPAQRQCPRADPAPISTKRTAAASTSTGRSARRSSLLQQACCAWNCDDEAAFCSSVPDAAPARLAGAALKVKRTGRSARTMGGANAGGRRAVGCDVEHSQ